MIPTTSGRRGIGLALCIAALALGVSHRTAHAATLRILIFRGYGLPDRVVVSGRVLRDPLPPPPDANASALSNTVDTLRMLETDEMGDVPVRVELKGRTARAVTDDDGLFRVELSGWQRPLGPGMHTVHVRLDVLSPKVQAQGEAWVLPAGPTVAIVTDFDDTVVQSGVTHKGELLARTLARNAAQIEAVPGAAAAYRAAARRAHGVFYVSGSPHNLYERIDRFLQLGELPRGPLFLKNFGEDPLFDQRGYKRDRLETLLLFFPELRLLLVGDSGEQDPEIYRALATALPERVVAIVIRRAPGGDPDPGRFTGMTVVDDWLQDPEVLARPLAPKR